MVICTLKTPFTDTDLAHARADFKKAGHNAIRHMFSPSTWLKVGVAALVVDVGSYHGVDLKAFMQRAGALADNVTIHTYEPVRATRNVLKATVALFPNIVVHPVGLGLINQRMCIDGVGDAALLRPLHMQTLCPVERRASVHNAWHELRSLSRPVDLLQLNCEGCEYPVLKTLMLYRSMARVVRAIEMQVHPRAVSARQYCELEARLRGLGYRLAYRHPFVWELWVSSISP